MIAKLAYFAVERAAEPVSNRLEAAAAQSPSFRAACSRIAKWQARLEYDKVLRRVSREQRLADESGLHVEPGRGNWVPADELQPPPELTEKEATQRGCELLGEAFVLSVGLALLGVQASQERRNEQEQEAAVEANDARITMLERTVGELRAENEALRRETSNLARRIELPPQRRSWWAAIADSHRIVKM